MTSRNLSTFVFFFNSCHNWWVSVGWSVNEVTVMLLRSCNHWVLFFPAFLTELVHSVVGRYIYNFQPFLTRAEVNQLLDKISFKIFVFYWQEPNEYKVYFCENQNNDLVIHRQVKVSDIISRRFSDFMTPLSRVQMRIKLTNASSRVTTNLHSGGGYTNTLAQIESVCTFKLCVNCLM